MTPHSISTKVDVSIIFNSELYSVLHSKFTLIMLWFPCRLSTPDLGWVNQYASEWAKVKWTPVFLTVWFYLYLYTWVLFYYDPQFLTINRFFGLHNSDVITLIILDAEKTIVYLSILSPFTTPLEASVRTQRSTQVSCRWLWAENGLASSYTRLKCLQNGRRVEKHKNGRK